MMMSMVLPSRVTLPDELIVEILSMFNVKSLMQLKCVSKSWNSIISDSLFVKLQLHKSSRIPHIILFSPHTINNGILPIFPISRLMENPSTSIFEKVYQHQLVKKGHQNIIGSCNGLICLYSSLENDFYLWNPATTSYSKVLRSLSHSFLHPNSLSKFSFGYDHLTKKYKLLAFRYGSKEVRIFTFGDNDWKNIQFFPVFPYSRWDNNGVYLNNSINWLALLGNNNLYCDAINVDLIVTISLDLGTEKYRQFLFPHCFDKLPPKKPILCKLMDCLCFSYCSRELDFVIWQMKEFGIENSWTKLLKFNYLGLLGCSIGFYLMALHVFENGDILIFERVYGQLIRYNMRDNRVVGKTTLTNNRNFLCVIPHVESLVSTYQN